MITILFIVSITYLRLNEELDQIPDEGCVRQPFLASLGTYCDSYFLWHEEALVEELAGGLRNRPVTRVHQLVNVLTVLVREDVSVMPATSEPHQSDNQVKCQKSRSTEQAK